MSRRRTWADNFELVGANPPQEYTSSSSVSGWVELASALAPNMVDEQVSPVTFLFTDTINSLGWGAVTESSFRLSTDASGSIVNWDVFLRADGPVEPSGERMVGAIEISSSVGDTGRSTFCILTGPFACDFTADSWVHSGGTSSVGAWAVNQVPAPSSLWLLGLAVAMLSFTRWRGAEMKTDEGYTV